MEDLIKLADFDQKRPATGKVKKWLFITGLFLILIFLAMYGCARKVHIAAHEALHLADNLHTQIADGKWDQVYTNSDEVFRKAMTREDSAALFSGVVRKLGVPLNCEQESTFINATTSGTILKTQCKTTFSKDSKGIEVIVWRKSEGQYHLLGYSVNSKDLIER